VDDEDRKNDPPDGEAAKSSPASPEASTAAAFLDPSRKGQAVATLLEETKSVQVKKATASISLLVVVV
jgi:hypothetical protein